MFPPRRRLLTVYNLNEENKIRRGKNVTVFPPLFSALNLTSEEVAHDVFLTREGLVRFNKSV
jgi:hypothetical protein